MIQSFGTALPLNLLWLQIMPHFLSGKDTTVVPSLVSMYM